MSMLLWSERGLIHINVLNRLKSNYQSDIWGMTVNIHSWLTFIFRKIQSQSLINHYLVHLGDAEKSDIVFISSSGYKTYENNSSLIIYFKKKGFVLEMETINIQYISVVTQRLCSPFPPMLPFSCCCPIKTWSFSLHLSSVSCLKGGTVCTPQLSPKVWRSLHVHNTDSMQFLMCSFKGLLKANGLCLPAGSIKSQNW